jgi:asparagine synthase (glutamine-hydrolysing)
MCGIAGIVSLGADLTDRDTEVVGRMTRNLLHRGPDGVRVYSSPKCVLGNARLKITDLSDQARLPFESPCGGVVLAYNGAVTNWMQLRSELETAGKHPLRSRSDAEVLVHLYEDRGIEFIDALNGMFAFCLYDEKRRRAYLARDFFGQRPLFTMRAGGRFYFASEIKAFLEIPGFDRSLDREGLHHFLSLAYYPGSSTPFEAVRELEGGRLVEFDLSTGRDREREYYALDYTQKRESTVDETAASLRERMLDAARRHFIADVPVGLMVSGGVDTGALLCLAKELGKSEGLHTFSIRMEDPSFDEGAWQKILVDHAKPVHHEISIGPERVLANLERHMAFLDEPSGDGAAIPTFILAEEASRFVRILLSGEGGDEIFNAYETHRAYGVRKLYRKWIPGLLRRLALETARLLPSNYSKLSFDFVSKRFTQGAELSTAEAHLFWRHAVSDEDKRALMPESLDLPNTASLFTRMFDEHEGLDELERLSLIDLRYYFVGDLMVKNDRMLMAHSIEGRYPYMDRRIAEFSAALPMSMKVRGLEGRWIQKRAMAGLLPESISKRANMGLEMPHSRWFLGPLAKAVHKHLSRERVEATGLLRHEAVDRLWREHREGVRDNGRALWSLINFTVWHKMFVESDDYKKHLLAPDRPPRA